MMEGFVEETVESKRGKTHYWIKSNENQNAKKVMFLHGLTASHQMFGKQLDAFTDTCTILVWDAPLHGVSRPYQDFSFGNMLQELKNILRQEKIDQIVLVGQSAGGYLAMMYAKTYPKEVEGILTIGAPPCDDSYYTKSDRFWLNQIEWMAQLYTDQGLRKGMAKVCGKTKYAYDNMIEMLKVFNKTELCHLMYMAFASMMHENVNGPISCPIWLTVGDSDKSGKVRKYNERMHEKEGYPLYIIPDAAHNANEDNPAEMNRVISEFLHTLSDDCKDTD